MVIIFISIIVGVSFFVYELKNSPSLYIDERGNHMLVKKNRKSEFPFNPMSDPDFEKRLEIIEWVQKVVESSKNEEHVKASKNLLNNLGILIHLSVFELPLERKEFYKIQKIIYELESISK